MQTEVLRHRQDRLATGTIVLPNNGKRHVTENRYEKMILKISSTVLFIYWQYIKN